MDAIVLQILNGLDKGAAYALIALGLTLVFGTLGVVSIEIPAGAGVAQDIRIHNGTIVGGDAGIIRHPGAPSERLVIEDMKLRDQGLDGIAIFDTIETVHIRRVSIRRTGASGITVIGPSFTNGSIEHCSIKETSDSGIVLDTVTHLLRTEAGKASFLSYRGQVKRPVDPGLLDLVSGWITHRRAPGPNRS